MFQRTSRPLSALLGLLGAIAIGAGCSSSGSAEAEGFQLTLISVPDGETSWQINRPIEFRSDQRQKRERSQQLLDDGRPESSVAHAELSREGVRCRKIRQREPVQQEQVREDSNDPLHFAGPSEPVAAQSHKVRIRCRRSDFIYTNFRRGEDLDIT